MRHKQLGFTLIELMIVVAIIGILAAVAIPQYQNYVARSQVSEAMNLVSGVKIAVAEYFNSNGTFPSGTGNAHSALGIATSSNIKGKYVAGVSVADDGTGVTTITMKSAGDAHSAVAGTTLKLTPSGSSGAISWTCAVGTMDAKYVPSACK
ncbi:MAG: prepilin-type cleavage/methylation domain-containing protein [Acidiferrobacteraceae bacterium]|nr:prepilin-type cleavage/methylation domain-containing protein [Acidiferrobacteraceae bacterium]|tara:strand:- start:4115 stop:4567 length:453 start_codon:yes stop_codon:yes gene_type:complete